MKVKTFEAQYELVEFNHYMDYNNNSSNVLDLVVECDNVDFIKQEFDNIFIIDTGQDHYVFSDYSLTECYEVGSGLVRVVCVK